ncbi:MAG: hypothetical protein HQL73_11120 [Magnetococcales bacterium]|nr:hypothetical protein [Magnetococcales bacterium]
MVSTTNTASMTADERLDEIARILAQGILRIKRKQRERENFSLENRNQLSLNGTSNNIDNKKELP